MPIVNCSNYMPCPSCFRWMHISAHELTVSDGWAMNHNAGTISDRSGFRSILDDFARAHGLI